MWNRSALLILFFSLASAIPLQANKLPVRTFKNHAEPAHNSSLTFTHLKAEEMHVDFTYVPYDHFTTYYEIQVPKHLQKECRPYKSMTIEVSLTEKMMKKLSRKPVVTATLSGISGSLLLEAIETKNDLKIVANYMKEKTNQQAKINEKYIHVRSAAERSLVYKVLRRALADYHSSCTKYNKVSQALNKRYHLLGKHASPLVTPTRPTAQPSQSTQIKQLAEFSISRKYEVTTATPSQQATKEFFTIELLTYKKAPSMVNLIAIKPVVQPWNIQRESNLPDFSPCFEVKVHFPNRDKMGDSFWTGVHKDSIWISPSATGVRIWKKSETVPAAIISKLKPLILEEIKNYQEWKPEYFDRLYQNSQWKTQPLHYIYE